MLGCAGPDLSYRKGEPQAFRARPDALVLPFSTSSGPQTAYYLGPPETPKTPPAALALAYPGIGSRALDWLPRLETLPPRGVGLLLLDYPGRGESRGTMRPSRLPETTEGALAALKTSLGGLPNDFRLVGHSFGTAAALQFAASDPRVTTVALLAPFTTLRRAAARVYGPLAYLMPDGMDNVERLRELKAKTPRPRVFLYHGDADVTLPVWMSRRLMEENADWAAYREFPGAGHVDVIDLALEEVLSLLAAPR